MDTNNCYLDKNFKKNEQSDKAKFSKEILIPKYRLDEVSRALKAQRLKNEEQKKLFGLKQFEYIKLINKLQMYLLVSRLVGTSFSKNFDTLFNLVTKRDFSDLVKTETIKRRIRKVKKSLPDLFSKN